MIRVETGKDWVWSDAIRLMALPLAGDLLGHSLDWIVRPLDEGGGEELLSCAVVGNEVVVTDLDIAQYVAEDNAWTVSESNTLKLFSVAFYFCFITRVATCSIRWSSWFSSTRTFRTWPPAWRADDPALPQCS